MIALLFLAPMVACLLAVLVMVPWLVLASWRAAEAPREADLEDDWMALLEQELAPRPTRRVRMRHAHRVTRCCGAQRYASCKRRSSHARRVPPRAYAPWWGRAPP